MSTQENNPLSRFSDNPFRPANPTPEQQEWYAKRDEALRQYRDTGDPTMAQEIGLFPNPESSDESKETEEEGMTLIKRIYEYRGKEFEVTRISPDSITIGLKCDDRKLEDFIIGTVEGHAGWGVGRKTSGGYILDDIPFSEAVNHCADALSAECDNITAIDQVDELFDFEFHEDENAPTLKERLDTLASFLPEFESRGFEFGTMRDKPDGTRSYHPSPSASRFTQVCSNLEWVEPFDWFDWKDSPEADRFWENTSAIAEATPEQLGRLLAVLIRLDRIAEGTMITASDSGLLVSILRRAATLAGDNEPEGADSLD